VVRDLQRASGRERSVHSAESVVVSGAEVVLDAMMKLVLEILKLAIGKMITRERLERLGAEEVDSSVCEVLGKFDIAT
jgi:hypothetical protein